MAIARLALAGLDCADPIHKAEEQPRPDQWRGYFDPAGHPFCLTANIPF